MATDAQGNDLEAVGIPTSGLWAFAPVAAANVIEDKDMGKVPITLPDAYEKLGLIKVDGGPQEGQETGDAIEFFQESYKLSSDGTVTISIGLAEGNAAVQQLTRGREPNEHGVIYVPASLPDATFILFGMTSFKNRVQHWRNGVARVQSIEIDQETRGEVRGKSVTFEWVPDPLFDGHPFKEWTGTPSAAAGQSAPYTAPGYDEIND